MRKRARARIAGLHQIERCATGPWPGLTLGALELTPATGSPKPPPAITLDKTVAFFGPVRNAWSGVPWVDHHARASQHRQAVGCLAPTIGAGSARTGMN